MKIVLNKALLEGGIVGFIKNLYPESKGIGISSIYPSFEKDGYVLELKVLTERLFHKTGTYFHYTYPRVVIEINREGEPVLKNAIICNDSEGPLCPIAETRSKELLKKYNIRVKTLFSFEHYTDDSVFMI